MDYFVCGWMDTRGEFDFRGVTTSQAKANKWVSAERERTKNWNIRQWPEAVRVKNLK